MPNYQLANEHHKQIIRKLKRRKVYYSFKDNIWGCRFSWYEVIKHIQKRNCVQLIFLVNMHGLFL